MKSFTKISKNFIKAFVGVYSIRRLLNQKYYWTFCDENLGQIDTTLEESDEKLFNLENENILIVIGIENLKKAFQDKTHKIIEQMQSMIPDLKIKFLS